MSRPSCHLLPLPLALLLSCSSSSHPPITLFLSFSSPLPVLQLVGILLAQILINQIRDQIKLQLYNQQHRADPSY